MRNRREERPRFWDLDPLTDSLVDGYLANPAKLVSHESGGEADHAHIEDLIKEHWSSAQDLATASFVTRMLASPRFAQADTILLVTDDRDFTSIVHLSHTLRPILARASVVEDAHPERWEAAFITPSPDNGCDNMHYCWAAVRLMEFIAVAAPTKHIIILDHDAAPTTLFNVSDLAAFAAAARTKAESPEA